MIPITLLGSDEVWVSPYRDGEAGGRTPLTLPPGENKSSVKLLCCRRGREGLEGSDPLDPRRGTVQHSSGEVPGDRGEGKRERIPKGTPCQQYHIAQAVKGRARKQQKHPVQRVGEYLLFCDTTIIFFSTKIIKKKKSK